MELKTIEDLRKIIKVEYGVDPEDFDGETLTYRAITFKFNRKSILNSFKDVEDTWTVQRTGHSIDFFKTAELKTAIDVGGSLLYYFMPMQRI
jgi:hypothetical protein